MREKNMGRFKVDVDLANNSDLILAKNGHLAPDKVRRMRIQGVVDSGAAQLVLPAAVIKQLGLVSTSKVKVRYADGRTAKRDRVGGVYLKLLDRDDVFSATSERDRETALIGAIVMEDLDLLVDCANQRLMPRDPKYVVSEIE